MSQTALQVAGVTGAAYRTRQNEHQSKFSAWQSTHTYVATDLVEHAGIIYKALQGSLAVTPTSLAPDWAVYVAPVATRTETSGPYTVVAGDTLILGDATAGAFDVDLPAAATSAGRYLIVKKIDVSGNAITVDGNSAETIDGAATVVLASQYDSVQLVCDGTEWWII
ncbi:MAG: hypothetical protein GY716_15685 [bacterium]|nr:hypothetical protein [bacterium]